MGIFKTTTSHYLNKDEFGDTDFNRLWGKLKNYVNNLSGDFISKEVNDSIHRIKLTTRNIDANDKIVLKPDAEPVLNKDLVRETFLNVEFDPETKSLVISDKNADMLDKCNQVSYKIMSERMNDPSNDDSLFFHESALSNSFDDALPSAQHEFVALLQFTEKMFPASSSMSGATPQRSTVKTAFLTFDETSGMLCENELNSINHNLDLDLAAFIQAYNENTPSDFSKTVVFDGIETTVKFSDFKLAKSAFRFYDEASFLRFLNFTPTSILNGFIRSLKIRLAPIWS